MVRAVVCTCGNQSYTKTFDFDRVLGPGPARPAWQCADCGRGTEREIRTCGHAKKAAALLETITAGRAKAPRRKLKRRSP